MKNISFSFLFLLFLFTSGCKKFIDVNQNPNNPSNVAEPILLSPIEAAIAENVAQGNASLLVNEWMQNLCLNQPVPNIETYQIYNQNFDGYWSDFYVINLNNLYILKLKAEANNNSSYAGIAKILMAYCIGNATDLWGNIPYDEAFKGNEQLLPVYEKQEDIYKSIQNLLDSAIIDIQNQTGLVPGIDDFFYNGNMDNWTKLAYTLKARYFMHLTNAPGYDKVAQSNLALQALANGMQSNDDDLKLPFPDPNQQNPLYLNTQSSSTLVMASNLVDSLLSRKDPRTSQLLTPGASSSGVDSGRQNGDPDVGVLEVYSLPGNFFGGPNAPCYIVNYNEAIFLQAEATFYSSGIAAANPIYRKGITSNFMKLGIDTNSVAAQAYLNARGTLTPSNVMQYMMTEKSIANYFSLENYVDWRRTGFPTLQVVPNAEIPAIPTRFLYPLVEIVSNPQAEQTATLTSNVWWDGN